MFDMIDDVVNIPKAIHYYQLMMIERDPELILEN
jgi:hypothetical protein